MPDATDLSPALLAVVVPTLNEERTIAALIGDLRLLEVPHEIIVVDGGSDDRTVAVAEQLGASVLRSRRGRAAQLAAGARAASAPILCFLHADVRLGTDALRDLAHAARSQPAEAFVFRFCIDARGWRFRFIELGAHWRVRLFDLPYGDQGLVVSRVNYEKAGGYPDVPVMEDVALVDALKRVTRIRTFASALPVSARRWQQDGPLRRMLRNWRLMLAYRLGAAPERLATRYPPLGDAPRSADTGAERG